MVIAKGVPEGWLGLVDQARLLGIHPESLLRRKRFGQLPPESYRKVGRSLFFNPQKISSDGSEAQHDN